MKFYIFLFASISLLASPLSQAKIYKWVDENGRTQFSDKPHPSAQEVSIRGLKSNKKQPPASHESKKPTHTIKYKSIIDSNILNLRKLLSKKEFKKLNAAIKQLDASYKSRTIDEDTYFTAYEAFRISDKNTASLFDDWAAATPNIYQPYLAKAIFQYEMGWLSRGGRWASETKDSQIKEMTAYFSASTDNLIKAINLKAPTIVPYYYLIGISNAIGRKDEAERFMRKAINRDPDSFMIRYHYIKTLVPRWGGSAEDLQAYISETAKYADLNPQLKIIEGFIYTAAGDSQATDRKYNVANTLYSKSLEIAPYHEVFFKRGKNNNRREDYEASLLDLNRAIELNNEKSDYYYWRATTLIDLKEYKKSMNDIQVASRLAPYDEDIQNKKKWLAHKFEIDAYKLQRDQNPESAVEKYTTAIRLNPDDASMYHGRARAYIQQRNLDLALTDLKKAIDIDPDNIDHYTLIDYVLARSKDWNQIIRYWDKFIKRHPNNGEAYLERGGTYYHKGDMKSAVRDAKASADLGNLGGMETYERFKKMVQ